MTVVSLVKESIYEETTVMIKRFEAQCNIYSVAVSKKIGKKDLSWLIKGTRKFVQSSLHPMTIVGGMELRE